MSPRYISETIEQSLLLVDAHPWYEVPDGYDDLVAETLAPLGIRAMGAAEVASRTADLVREVFQPGDLVVIPLMCGAILAGPACERAAAVGAHVVLLPLSRHPFVSLSADPPRLLAHSCAQVAESSRRLAAGFFGVLDKAADRFRRFVFLDCNSATGRDFVLFRELVEQCAGRVLPAHFSVLVAESAEDDMHGPGHRGGPKVKVPDSAALRLVGLNTKYLSHLRFLRRGQAQQLKVAEAMRGAQPALTAYWEQVPPRLRHIHNYEASPELIHARRLHIRPGHEDLHRTRALSEAVASLDALAPLRISGPSGRRRAELITGWHSTMSRLANDGSSG